MSPFTLIRPRTHEEAARVAGERRWRLPVLKAGGLDVVDHLKEHLVAPDALVDVRPLRRDGAGDGPTRRAGERLEVEAGATLAQLADDAAVRRDAPALAAACGSAATPQVRTVATAAGNLLQRPRCWYYRSEHHVCAKKGGSRCPARNGENRYHAILGADACNAVHPSNVAVALSVMDARVHLVGGDRAMLPLADLFVSPDEDVTREHRLERGEVVTHLDLVPAPASGFHAIKQKASFDWPLACAAAALELEGTTIRAARLCAGAVAPIPWRLPAVERALVGVRVDDDAALRAACAVASRGAVPLAQNAYKVRLLPVTVRRAVLRAAGRPVEEA